MARVHQNGPLILIFFVATANDRLSQDTCTARTVQGYCLSTRLPIATAISTEPQRYSEFQPNSFSFVGPNVETSGFANLAPRQNLTTHLYLYYAQM